MGTCVRRVWRCAVVSTGVVATLALAPAAAGAQTHTWAGVWDTTYGTMVLKQKGNKVTGVYNYDTDKSEIRATAKGNTLEGVWDERPSECDTGPIFFTMSADGLYFDGTWGPGCGSGGSWEGTRSSIGLPLQVQVKANAPAKSVEVTAINVGNDPVEGVQVRGVSTKRLKTTCGEDSIKFRKSGATENVVATLYPGQSLSGTFKYEEVCPGSTKVTGRAIAAQGVEAMASTTVKVADTAFITGVLDLTDAGYGQSMTADDRARLFKNLRVRAVGKKTLTARPDAASGAYKFKVPNNGLGRYELSVAGNKAAEVVRPDRPTVTAVRGKTINAETIELGYSCDVDPMGMKFTPVNGTYSGPPMLAAGLGGEAVKYRCRSQRVLISVVSTGSASTTCVRSDGSTYELELSTVHPYEHPVLDARAASVAPLTAGQFTLSIQTRIQDAGVPGIPIQVTGSFTSKRTGTMRMSHPECSWLNREGPLELAD